MGLVFSKKPPPSPPTRAMLLQRNHLVSLPYGKCAPEHVESVIDATIMSVSRIPAVTP